LLALETGIAQHAALLESLAAAGLRDGESRLDLRGRERFLLARRYTPGRGARAASPADPAQGRSPIAPACCWELESARAASSFSTRTSRQSQGFQEFRRQRKFVGVWLAAEAWIALCATGEPLPPRRMRARVAALFFDGSITTSDRSRRSWQTTKCPRIVRASSMAPARSRPKPSE